MSAPQDPKKVNPRLEQAGASDEAIQNIHSVLLREKQEPTEEQRMTPMIMLGILGFVSAMIFFVCVYLVHFRGGLNPGFDFFDAALVYDERFKEIAKDTGPAKAVDPIVAGRRLYATMGCIQCHGAAGAGTPGMFPPLAKSEWVEGSEERLVRILLNGMNGPVTVKGNVYNGAMPAFKDQFNDEKLAHVLTFIRQEWGNAAPAIAPEKVAEIRKATAARGAKPWTEAELLAIP